jgi:hypothetical protein
MSKKATENVKVAENAKVPARKLTIRTLDKIETTKICTITGD